MNIGIDARAIDWYNGTGIGTYVFNLINSLNNIDKTNNYDIFMSNIKNLNYNKNFSIKYTNYHNNSIFWNTVDIPNNIQNQNLSLYHVPQNGIGLPKQKSCPFITTLHDIIPSKMPETVSETYLNLYENEMPNIIKNSDAIITVSNYSKQDIIKTFNYPKQKIFVTYLACDSYYTKLDKNKCKYFIKEYYKISDPFILYIGGFSPRKNILGLINAFSKLKSNNLKLIIGGSKGKSYEIYKKRVYDLNMQNKVIFTGFIPKKHLVFFYNAAEVFVYPSFYEGFGLPPIEAMACGTPVISSNKTSMPEILSNSAYFIDPYNVDSIYSSIKQVLENIDLRNLLIKKGFKLSKSLNWNKTAKKTLMCYEKLYKLYK